MAGGESLTLATALQIAGLVVLITVGIVIIVRLHREIHERPEPETNLLTTFQEAYDAGEIDEAEYQRVRESLERRERSAEFGPAIKTTLRDQPSADHHSATEPAPAAADQISSRDKPPDAAQPSNQ